MSFFTLLLLLSLIVIVPIFFVMKEKSAHSQTNSTQRHQQYLTSSSSSVLETKIETSSSEKINALSVIEFSSSHPFIKCLYNQHVPEAFRKMMDDIGQQYESTHHEQITESQLFIINKLISTRIPELLSDYLSLDAEYAKNVIIDPDKETTSYTMVLGQLSSILDFSQKLNTQSQSGVVDKLLASRRYLDDVYQESGMENDNLKIK